MNALEALSFLMQQGDAELSKNSTLKTDSPELSDHETQLQLALSVCQAMLHTALPIARFRAHATLTPIDPNKAPSREFTCCAVDIDGIKAGLYGVKTYTGTVHITLWEQKASGAEMLSGHQGYCRGPGLGQWLKLIEAFQEPQTKQ